MERCARETDIGDDPESMAFVQRKAPLGKRSQCCGQAQPVTLLESRLHQRRTDSTGLTSGVDSDREQVVRVIPDLGTKAEVDVPADEQHCRQMSPARTANERSD